MSEKPTAYTSAQQQVIDLRGQDMLVSASAGTGKTTVMIERIAKLLSEGADISEIVVVTFTNLAAAEMRNRLAAKLSARKNDKHIIDQLERLDSASICTLHSFCSEILRNYFYVADIDPSYTILDSNLVSNLRKSAMDEVFLQYYAERDEVFKQAYKIFAKSRQQSNFVKVLYELYDFSRCIPNFDEWYLEKRANLLNLNDDNTIIVTLLNNVKQNVEYYKQSFSQLSEMAQNYGLEYYAAIDDNVTKLNQIRLDNLEHALSDLYTFSLTLLPSRPRGKKAEQITDEEKRDDEEVRYNFKELKDRFDKFIKRFNDLSRGLDMQTLREQTSQTVVILDKLVEIINRFDKIYFAQKKERGGVDFNDLEHLTLKILNDPEALSSIRSKYKLVFVDEYQDTNPVQEAIISRLATHGSLFMVGDVKQSIYGFRGCEPAIFVDKYRAFKEQGTGCAVELNDNFRSNAHILDFVNEVFDIIMTDEFGKVDYKNDARLRGTNPPTLSVPSTRIDFVVPVPKEKREIEDVYDITAENDQDNTNKQAALVVRRVNYYLGQRYFDKNGVERRIDYGDIVILLRAFQEKALSIYNALIAANIPVVAGFKVDGYATKEIKDLINLMRVLDNPYNDLYLVGVCLSCFGNFSESELGAIRLDTSGRVPFYDRLKQYAIEGDNVVIADKISKLLNLLDELRFYSRSASVSEVALKTLELTDYHLYVQGLPNSGLRLRKMYNFIDSVKDAPYAQSIDRFLTYIDEAEENVLDDSVGSSNAVKMMTMHASKGLEFPVVIIADMEHRFKRDDAAIDRNFDMGIAMRYYDFETMTYAPTLATAAYGMYNAIKSNEEQMRLLYVAMTRAKFALDLVGTATVKQINSLPKLPQDAISHLDWILTTVKLTRGTNFNSPDDNVQINIFDEVEETVDVSDRVPQICEQETDEQAVMDKLRYEYPFKSQTEMPVKVVSSALDKAYIGVNDQPETVFVQDDDRNLVGTAYHKVYQYVDYKADKQQIKRTIEQLVCDEQMEQRIADKLDIQLIHNTLGNPQLVEIVSKGEVYHELPFMLYAPYNEVAQDGKYSDEVMLQGVIDLLVINGDKATVVDFKYTSRSDRVKDNYTAQLNSYKLAVRKICGIENVDCYVLSIADNKLIKF